MVSESDDLTAMDYGDTAPTVEVIVYRHGEVVHRELCESAEAAADVVDQWSEACWPRLPGLGPLSGSVRVERRGARRRAPYG
jgi:hypothetical protein